MHVCDHPRHRPRARQRPAPPRRRATGITTGTTSGARTNGFKAVRAVRQARTGPSGSRTDRGRRSRSCDRSPSCSAAAKKVMLLSARGAEQHSKGTDTVTALINLALALGLPGQAGLRLRVPDRPGQRPGGSRTRPEGRSAARLPDDHRPGGAEHVAAVWGVAGRLPARARACRRPSCSIPSASRAAPGDVPARQQPGRVRSGRVTVAERLRSLDLLVVADFVLSESAALADVVLPITQWAEETGTMTNLEGRVLLPPQGGRSAGGRPHRPRDPQRARRPARRPGQLAPTTRSGVRRTAPAPAPAARPTTRASPTSDRCRRRRLLALLHGLRGIDPPVRRGCSLDRFATPTAAPTSSPVEHRPVGRGAATAIPALPHHRPGACPVPVRRADPADQGALNDREPSAFVEAAPRPRRDAEHRRGRRARGTQPPRRGPGTGPDHRHASGPTPSSCRSTGPVAAAPTGSPTPRWTRSRGCPSSRCARSR